MANPPLAGPKQIEEFKPYYRRIWDMLADRGAVLFDQDSDDISPASSAFGCGHQLYAPHGTAAGVDVVKIREQYGNRLAFYGGIDKHVLRRSKEIIAELEYKIPPCSHGRLRDRP